MREERAIRSHLVFILLALSAMPMAASAQSVPPGRAYAATCFTCHGTDGRSVDGMPPLAGKPREFLSQSLKDFRDGRRPGTLMPQLAKGYSDEQIELLAGWLASQGSTR